MFILTMYNIYRTNTVKTIHFARHQTGQRQPYVQMEVKTNTKNVHMVSMNLNAFNMIEKN